MKNHRSLLALSLSILSISVLCYLMVLARIAYATENPTQISEIERLMTPEERKVLNELKPDKRATFITLVSMLHASQAGPANINILDQAVIYLSENDVFIPSNAAAKFNELINDVPDDNLVGIIISKDLNFDWYITVDFLKLGYMRDKDADSLNISHLLKSVKRQIAIENSTRLANGGSPIEITGWFEAPSYDDRSHKLTLSYLLKEDSQQAVNYRQILFGREGFIVFGLIALKSQVTENIPNIQRISSTLYYKAGKRHEDFVEGRDRVIGRGVPSLLLDMKKQIS